MPFFEFTVDAALLRELGERLVGQPHIALAELIKNSYDADANKVIVRIDSNKITVTDDGDGMSPDRFRDFWMRIGSPHKQRIELTRKNRRPTGSKGIGRLAVQFLGSGMALRTSPRKDDDHELIATVDWAAASRAKDLTRAKVEYSRRRRRDSYANGKPHGVEIVITGLNQHWGEEELRSLAQQVWQLQPPFRQGSESDFDVELEHADPTLKKAFGLQLHRNLDIWSARIRGKLLPQKPDKPQNQRTVRLYLEFPGEAPETHLYEIRNCDLHSLEFEIRVFSLYHRQKYGVAVEDAREYLAKYGGVHLYDGGFHLPYYGPETDWLRTEIDHSHRLSRSKLLPEELQIESGLNNLPTNSRLYGIVRVDTSFERDMAAKEKRLRLNEFLQIQASRDRLVDNPAYRTLRDIVRYSLDFYAVRQTVRMQSIPEKGRVGETASAKVRRVEEILESYRTEIPDRVYKAVTIEVREAIRASETEADAAVKQMGLMGALATAGIAAIAYEHEAAKQLTQLEQITKQIRRRVNTDVARELTEQLNEWIKTARRTRALFAPLNDEENRETRTKLRVQPLLENLVENLRPLLGSVTIELGEIDQSLRFPPGTVAEWSAIFQNVLINSANAMLDAPKHVVRIWSHGTATRVRILVEDTGSGINLRDAESLFQPFVRKLEISRYRRELGLGGMGMGLAIVRMVANNLNCRARFVQPSAGFGTAFELSWVNK